MIISKKCPVCGKENSLEVNQKAFEFWQTGDYLVQEAFPDLGTVEQEFIKTGCCRKCQRTLFGINERARIK